MKDRTLVIFTLNEIEGVKALFGKIPFEEAGECFVVDGGSCDGTREFFRQRGVKVLAQDSKGRGEAFRLAVNNASFNSIVFFSPDGNEDPQDIKKLFQKLECGYDMVIASRFLKGARNEEDGLFFPLRAWVNRIFTLAANLLWNKNGYVSDTINGFRAITRSAFKGISPDATGFVIEYQLSIRAMKRGYKICEIPTCEGNRIGGRSSARSLPTGLLFLKFFLRECFAGNRF